MLTNLPDFTVFRELSFLLESPHGFFDENFVRGAALTKAHDIPNVDAIPSRD